MASSVIHICIANEINKELKRDNNKILIGAIAPDISKLLGESKFYSHFLDNVNNNIPNINKFLDKYGNYLDDDFVLGYYIHLYTDYLWFKYFIPNIFKDNYIKELDGTLIKYTRETFKYYVYNDYTNMNIQLINKYNFPLKIFYEEIPSIPNIISEIPMNRLDLIINKTSLLIEEAKQGKKYIFKIDDTIKFISDSKEIILKEINKNITLILTIIFILTGCNYDKIVAPLPSNDKIDDTIKEPTYTDNNPIKLGIFLSNNNYYNKEVIEDTYYTSLTNGVDIGSFEVFLTDDKTINGTKFKDTWQKYYDKYEDINKYKIGYNIGYTLKDGTSYNSTFLEPDIFRYSKYFYIYFYDDVNAPNGFYSHLENVNDNTLMTSVKLYAVDEIDEVESITLIAFTYDEDDIDKDNNYRGNSKYTINIKRK